MPTFLILGAGGDAVIVIGLPCELDVGWRGEGGCQLRIQFRVGRDLFRFPDLGRFLRGNGE